MYVCNMCYIWSWSYLLQKSFQKVMTRGLGDVAKKNKPKKELWKKEDMQRGNRVWAHRKTVQDKRASLNQVVGDPKPTEGNEERWPMEVD